MSKLKDKKICKLAKDDCLEEDLKAFKRLVANPTHLCLKCGRVAIEKKLLCKPEKLD